jgi:hypothetical protein
MWGVALDLDRLLIDLEHAPTPWIRDTLEHLDMIRRSDVIMRGDHWELVALQDEAARAFDVLLVELGRRVAVEDD